MPGAGFLPPGAGCLPPGAGLLSPNAGCFLPDVGRVFSGAGVRAIGRNFPHPNAHPAHSGRGVAETAEKRPERSVGEPDARGIPALCAILSPAAGWAVVFSPPHRSPIYSSRMLLSPTHLPPWVPCPIFFPSAYFSPWLPPPENLFLTFPSPGVPCRSGFFFMRSGTCGADCPDTAPFRYRASASTPCPLLALMAKTGRSRMFSNFPESSGIPAAASSSHILTASTVR